jgi:hypothetical protein
MGELHTDDSTPHERESAGSIVSQLPPCPSNYAVQANRRMRKFAYNRRGSGMQILTRGILAGALLLALLFPYAAFIAARMSPFVTFWEFASYSHFGAMSYFEPNTLPFWMV